MPHQPGYPRISRWRALVVWLVVIASILVAGINLIPASLMEKAPSVLADRRLHLGLDVVGGSQLGLRIEREAVLAQRLRIAVDAVGARLKATRIAYRDLSGAGDRLSVTITDPVQVQAALKALAALTEGGSDLKLLPADGATLSIEITPEGLTRRIAALRDDALPVLRRRLAALGLDGGTVAPRGADRIAVQVRGDVDAERLKTILSTPGELTFHLIDGSVSTSEAEAGNLPAGSAVFYTADDPPVGTLVRRQPVVSSHDVSAAEAVIDGSGHPAVDLHFSEDGARRLAEATGEAAGGRIAVALDGLIITKPTVSGAITGGSVRLAPDMTSEGAEDLATVLRAGALPASVAVVEERSSGAGLRADALGTLVLAGLVATALIGGLMVGFYGLFGLVATGAVLLNVVMIIAVLTLTGLPLTLPGVAGIVLTIGMAVDANVLIFERVREEARRRGNAVDAVHYGFQNAFAAIVDANVTTLMAAIVLLYLGTGTVRGFAVTLAIGIVTTLFTAYTVTRIVLEAGMGRRALAKAIAEINTGFFATAAIRFMAVRNIVFAALSVLSLTSLLLLANLGLNLGIDFSGGSVVELSARQGGADPDDIEARLEGLNIGDVSVTPLSNPRDVVVRVQSRDSGDNAEQTPVILMRGELEDDYQFRRVDVVAPVVSESLAKAATIGLAVALFAILAYVWMRFAWQFAAGAVIAILHDVILTIGLFTITGIEFNMTSVAALLTIIGYSLNDTMVIYDRVRSVIRRFPMMPLPIAIDTAINQTLSRTLLTAATTLLALAALCVFGGPLIRPFALVMFFGIAAATFSSIYVAGPVLILFRLTRMRRGARPDAAAADMAEDA
ncbi:protein translocase subunit SecDF [Xaviernesmea oryzae]|uniref:Multifunctional fusion protein n=1 Tax=Xaviernesmea oryzae TaxID=464029 RepID=A0A1Q9AX31_9HYPH|nr:protein translocase subunit SecD [Xaviernesmea oryzae]OLP59988.1 protein translocase subunit SecDF [Xaviernesmea oryzae]SEK41536.1 SecD/SecF fusion protein [Xaviernesmea oryzae]